MPSKNVTISSVRAVTKPIAHCKHHECAWHYPSMHDVMGSFVTGREVRAEAKSHARFKPGHVVNVVINDITSYWAVD